MSLWRRGLLGFVLLAALGSVKHVETLSGDEIMRYIAMFALMLAIPGKPAARERVGEEQGRVEADAERVAVNAERVALIRREAIDEVERALVGDSRLGGRRPLDETLTGWDIRQIIWKIRDSKEGKSS